MAKLSRIQIGGYKSIKQIDLELRDLNVLIGANGAGKSNFISFFKMLNEMMGGRLQQYIAMNGRGYSLLHFGPKITREINASLEFRGQDALNIYSMRLFHVANDTLLFADETLEYRRESWQGEHRPPMSLGAGHPETRIGDLANEGNLTARAFRHMLNQCRFYHFHDTSPTARIRFFGYINDNRWLMPDAGNLAALLYRYRQRNELVYNRIVATIRKVMPDFLDFDLAPSRLNPKEIELSWRQQNSNYLFGPHQISDGTLRAMALFTLFLQPEDELPDVIVLDEPELGLHPYGLQILAGLMRAASVAKQVIVATQSETFLNNFDPSEIIVADSHQGESRCTRLEAEELKDWLEDYSIGELWQRNVVGGGPVP